MPVFAVRMTREATWLIKAPDAEAAEEWALEEVSSETLHMGDWEVQSVERALARFKATFDEDSRTETTEQVAQSYLAAPLLVLDDMGASKATAWADETVFAIVNSRYEALAPTIVTANDENDGWQALHPRMKSRLLDAATGTVQMFTGPDRRAGR